MPKRFSVILAGLFVASVLCPVSAATAQGGAKRSITKITGNLYRFQNNFHYSVFLVTPDGIIATDPINADAARWLKRELKKQFDKSVRYLVYSHDHVDHVAGGEVFADTAIVVAHENAKSTIVGEQRPTAVPDVTFSDRMTIELGGKTVHLLYVGKAHSNNMIVMHFPVERAVFTVDFISVRRLPYKNLSDSYYPEWIESIKMVEAIDFDILIPGHGTVGTRADASNHRAYHEDLYSAVLTAARAGKTLEEMQQSIRLEKYKDWSQYKEWLALNIEGVYERVKLHRRGN